MGKLGRALAVLDIFIDTIEVTGGVIRDRDGLHAPVADPEWVDLGEAYTLACAVVGKEPKVQEED